MTFRDPEVADRLRRLARHLPVFEGPGFSFGDWVKSRERADGVIVMGWYEPGPEARALLADLAGWVTPFDWPAWAASAEGQALMRDPDAVASATPEDLGRLLTTYVRGDRFTDGTLEAAFESGLLTAILRRAAALAADP